MIAVHAESRAGPRTIMASAVPAKRVSEQWYCRLAKAEWEMHKASLTALAQDVHDAWQEIRRSGSAA